MADKARRKMINGSINIKYEPMNIRGDIVFKCVNDDWGVIAFDIRRSQLENKHIQFVDKELQYNCIYFLVGYEGLTEKVYVGQAKKRNNMGSALIRLREHAASKIEEYNDIWTRAIVVTGKDDTWGPTELNALEHIFYNSIPIRNRLNGNNPNASTNGFEQYEDKVRQIKLYLSTLSIDIFNAEDTNETVTVQSVVNEHSTVEDLQNGMSTVPEIVTPYSLIDKTLKSVDDSVWNPYAKFLDMACKGGEYLKAIYDKLMNTESLIAMFPNDIARSNHILSKQIYGLAVSEVSKQRTIDSLNGFGYNIKIITHYIDKIKHKDRSVILDEVRRLFGVVKFDVVIGNPPYQEVTGGGNNGGKVIYDKFIMSGLELSDKVCMIVKNNWMNSESLKSLRDTLVNNGLKSVVNYSLLGDAFPGMGIAASVIYANKEHKGDLEYTNIVKGEVIDQYSGNVSDIGFIPASMHEYDIVKKVQRVSKESFNFNIIGSNPFGIDTNGAVSSGFIDENDTKTDYYNIAIKYIDSITYTNIGCINKGLDIVDKYKIICPKQIHKTNNPIPSVIGLLPGQICSGSYSIMYYSDSQDEAYNVSKYIKTQFFRYLTYCLADSLCRLNQYRISLVPNQDFTTNSDIDWSKSISDIDEQLYKKYSLTENQIEHIKSTIKAME